MPLRVALIIGNADYRTGKLKNPLNDARAIAHKLEDLGFTVDLQTNLNQKDMIAVAARFYHDRAQRADIRLVYFSGHGVEHEGHNYLIPVDGNTAFTAEIPRTSFQLDELRQGLDSIKQGLNLIILDTCRVSLCPTGHCRGVMSTLALGQEKPSRGTLVAYSTAPGELASDGPSSSHSLYTETLLSLLDEPGLSIESVFRRLNELVRERSADQQQPEFVNGLSGARLCLRLDAEGHCNN